MSIRESGLWTPDRDFVRGRATVELFNAKTGKLEAREQGENYVAAPMIDTMKWAARMVFAAPLR